MKTLYFLRVFFISFEFVICLLNLLIITYFDNQISLIVSALTMNEEVAKFLILAPIGLFIKILQDSNNLIFENTDLIKTLRKWEDYWKLKLHIYVSLIYAFMFLIISGLTWFNNDWMNSSQLLIPFVLSLIGLAWIYGSIYFAKMNILEAIHQ